MTRSPKFSKGRAMLGLELIWKMIFLNFFFSVFQGRDDSTQGLGKDKKRFKRSLEILRWNSTQGQGFTHVTQNWAGFWEGDRATRAPQSRSTARSSAACTEHTKRSYLKSLPILLPLSGIPGSGHKLCPWDTPTWVTTKQKTAHTETE